MSNTNMITTIDIWSSKIRTIIWWFNQDENDKFEIFWIWVANSTAMKKWNILDMEEFKNNIDKSLEEAEKMAGQQISSVYLSLNSSSFEVSGINILFFCATSRMVSPGSNEKWFPLISIVFSLPMGFPLLK